MLLASTSSLKIPMYSVFVCFFRSVSFCLARSVAVCLYTCMWLNNIAHLIKGDTCAWLCCCCIRAWVCACVRATITNEFWGAYIFISYVLATAFTPVKALETFTFIHNNANSTHRQIDLRASPICVLLLFFRFLSFLFVVPVSSQREREWEIRQQNLRSITTFQSTHKIIYIISQANK